MKQSFLNLWPGFLITFHIIMQRLSHTCIYFVLQEISPQDYTKLFGEFLDSDVLLRVLQVFKEFYVQ